MNKAKYLLICAFLVLLVAVSENLFAQNGVTPGMRYKEKHANKGSKRYSSSGSSGNITNENTEAANDSIANQQTGLEAKKEFMKQTGFPMGRPGYIVDYKEPIEKGGCDCVSNMQWITIAEAKAQGKLE